MTSPLSGSIAALVNKALGGIFLDAVLTRDGVTTGPEYNPTPGTPVNYACKAIRDNYEVSYRAGGLVQSSDVKIIILQRSLSVTPVPGDTITITEHNKTYTIAPATAGQPSVSADPANATWECRAMG